MLKRDESAILNSCWNKARAHERVFVLIGRDFAAPVAIRAWAAERIRLGHNKPDDPQIAGALEDAKLMEQEQYRAANPNHGGGMADRDSD